MVKVFLKEAFSAGGVVNSKGGGLSHRLFPTGQGGLGLVAADARLKAAVNPVLGFQLLQATVKANGQTRQIGRAQSRGFDNGGPHHRHAEQVGLRLHQ